jgi:hypothetical protein
MADWVHFELQDNAKPAKRDRSVLNASDARNIYKLKFLAHKSTSTPNGINHAVSSSVLLAEQYCVDSKTIRDIWNRKSWTQVTQDLFDQGETDESDATERSNMDYMNQQVCVFP